MLIGRLTQDGRAIAELVGGGLRGADRGERTWVARLAVPGAAYVIVPLCLGNQPTANPNPDPKPNPDPDPNPHPHPNPNPNPNQVTSPLPRRPRSGSPSPCASGRPSRCWSARLILSLSLTQPSPSP